MAARFRITILDNNNNKQGFRDHDTRNSTTDKTMVVNFLLPCFYGVARAYLL
jgi:hypothetical protein